MSPELVQSTLRMLQEVLSDLKPNVLAPREIQDENHYEIERQVQLAADLSLTIARRILNIKNLPATSSARETFESLGKNKLLPQKLAKELADAASMRNLLVHEYGRIDYDLFFGQLKQGYGSFVKFSAVAAKLSKKSK